MDEHVLCCEGELDEKPKFIDDRTTKEPDMVNHPPHYERKGGMECIDEMIAIYGPKAVAAFCVCNAHKYRYRAHDKNGTEDIKKSDWYMHKYIEICGAYHITSQLFID